MLKTAESVSIAHPDKICDQISDAILDACLKEDPYTRAAIEVMGGHGIITITGELSTKTYVNMRQIALDVYRECGYTEPVGVQVNVVEQSPEIGHGVDNDGAGDQGIMVGYATNETPEMMPLEVMLARRLSRAMAAHDAKSQVTVEAFDEKDSEKKEDDIVQKKIVSILTSLCDNGNMEDVKLDAVVEEFSKEFGADMKKVWMRNPNGAWTVGGFAADTGLTGRKLAVDNYGPHIPVGGGAFSGKDATKVDRSGAYMARKIAVDYLRAKNAKEVFVHLAYAIGVAEPLMAVASINDGTKTYQEKVTGYDLRPQEIIKFLDLRKPQFRQTAKYGHFGNGFTWDK